MKLKLKNVEAGLVRQALMDVMVNSPHFTSYEKQYLQNVYRKLQRYEKKKQIFSKWY